MYFDTKVNKPSRIGYALEGDKKVRISKKSGSKIDKQLKGGILSDFQNAS